MQVAEIKPPSDSELLDFHLAALYGLRNIPPNTCIHKSKTGHFVTTGKSVSILPGTQTVANYAKGYTPEKTADNIYAFATKLSEIIGKLTEAALLSKETPLHHRTFRNLIYINQRVNQAVKGKVEGWGLEGLHTTYKGDDYVEEKFKGAIDLMKESAFKALKAVRDLIPEKEQFPDLELSSIANFVYDPDKKPYCPEESYTSEEWESAIVRSASLQEEYVGLFRYYVRFAGGLLYNQTRSAIGSAVSGVQSLVEEDAKSSYQWWNKLGRFEEADLFLGALPLKIQIGSSEVRDDLIALKEEGVKAILTVTQVFENNSSGYITSSITPENCQKLGIKHLQLPTSDCETIFFQLIQRGVEYIHWCLSNKLSILVHCKAGRGRSLLLILCYLIKYFKISAEKALEFAQEKRPQAGFSKESSEWQTLKTFERLYST